MTADALGPSDYDRESIGAILGGEGTWWSAVFMRLVAKSDPVHRARLARVFPEHVRLVEDYMGMRHAGPVEP